MDAIKKYYQKFLKEPSKKDILKIWKGLPLIDKVKMILKQFNKKF